MHTHIEKPQNGMFTSLPLFTVQIPQIFRDSNILGKAKICLRVGLLVIF